ncbi:MAG: apolipoprotein N-acyltransferase [Colwellia sp.]
MALTQFFNKQHGVVFLLGMLLVFSYAPFSFWPLALFIPAIVFSFIQDADPKKSASILFIFAFGWFCAGISWVHVSIDQFGGLPLIISLALMLLLCLYLACFSGLAGYLTARLSRHKQLNLLLFPPVWLLCEYFRSVFLTGFPWLSLGYSQIDSPLASFAPIIGEVGITGLILYINIAIYSIVKSTICCLRNKRLLEQKELNTVLLCGAFLVASIMGSYFLSKITWTTPQDKSIKVAIIQGNIEQSLKWKPELEWPTMLKYLDLTRVNNDADLIVWPESAVPALEPASQDYLSTVNRSALFNNSAIITGIQNYDQRSKKYYNGLIVLGKKNKDDELGYYYESRNRYYKNHLLPIGEFVPFQSILRPLAPLFNLPMSSFSSGPYQQENLKANGLSILPLICFEIAFPHQLAVNFTNQTDIILTVSNDAWFGDSHGPHQHMDIARMRAIEFGRPVIRSTNNGVTAVVGSKGEMLATIPQFEEAVLRVDLPLVTGTTPYSHWPRATLFLMIFVPFLLFKILEIRKL